jgi:hypothetical protein
LIVNTPSPYLNDLVENQKTTIPYLPFIKGFDSEQLRRGPDSTAE